MFSCWVIFGQHLFWRTSEYGCFWTDFTKRLFGTLFLDSRFQNHPSIKCKSLSTQSFKHNSAHMPSLFLIPTLFLNLGFIYLSLMATTQKADAWSSRTSCYKLRKTLLEICLGDSVVTIRVTVITNYKDYYKLGQMILGQLLEIGQENIYQVLEYIPEILTINS